MLSLISFKFNIIWASDDLEQSGALLRVNDHKRVLVISFSLAYSRSSLGHKRCLFWRPHTAGIAACVTF